MQMPEATQNQHPPGYPASTTTTTTENQNQLPPKKKWFSRTQKKGDRGFIEGCLFALCCCWICEMCF